MLIPDSVIHVYDEIHHDSCHGGGLKEAFWSQQVSPAIGEQQSNQDDQLIVIQHGIRVMHAPGHSSRTRTRKMLAPALTVSTAIPINGTEDFV